MRVLRQLSFKIRALLRQNRKQDDLNEEIETHLEILAGEYRSQGMDAKAARRAALRDFGGVEQVKEDCRDAWGVRLLAETYRDIHYALRQLFKSKGFATITVFTLCVCLGANAAIFSLLHSVLVRPFDFPEPDRVVNIGMQWRTSHLGDAVLSMSPRRYLDIEQSATSYKAMGFIVPEQIADVWSETGASRILYSAITPGAWEVAGVKPLLGRTFDQADLDAGNNRVVILSYRLWQRLFGGTDAAIGSEIRLDDRTYRVIGVMPRDFYLVMNRDLLWTPFEFDAGHKSERSRRNNSFYHLARLKDGVTVEQAQSELDAIYLSAPAHQPAGGEEHNLDEESYGIVLSKNYIPRMVPVVKTMFWSMQGAVTIILLVGCLNVASLILVRNHRRSSELSMRHALGAAQSRLFRQLVTETVVLFLIAGALSLPVAHGILYLFDFATMGEMPIGLPTRLNGSVLAIVFVGFLACGLVFGSLPAWRSVRQGLQASARCGTRSATSSSRVRWIQNAFVVGQISVTIILLVGSGALFKEAHGVRDQDFGYALENTLMATVSMPEYQYSDNAAVDSFRERTRARLAKIPGVVSVGFSSRAPLSIRSQDETSFEVRGYEPGPRDQPPHGTLYVVSDDYFAAMQTDLVAGRGFEATDGDPDAELVTVVSESVARDHLQGKEPIGSMIKWRGKDYRIIGLASDTIDYAFYLKEPRHTVYLPASNYPDLGRRDVAFAMRTAMEPLALANSVREAILDVGPQLAKIDVFTPYDSLSRASMAQTIPAAVTLSFALVAMILSLLGLYAVMSFMVSERHKEIGIRVALGASSSAIARRLYGWSGRLAGAGIVIGCVCAYPMMLIANPALPHVDATAADMFAVAAIIVGLTVLGSAYLPVCRANRIDPMTALRIE